MTSQTAHVDNLPEHISASMSTDAKLVLFSLSTYSSSHQTSVENTIQISGVGPLREQTNEPSEHTH